MKEEEIILIKQAKTDPEAFGRLYDSYYKKIFNYILRSTYDLDISQDITSETFFKALKNISKFKITKAGTFQSWLYTIATNELNQFYRKNNKYTFQPTEDIDTYYSEDVPEEEISGALEKMDMMQDLKELQEEISKLDEKYRNIINLRFFEQLKFSEIAEITGTSEGTLKSHMSRALSQLKDKMQEKYPDRNITIGVIILLLILLQLFSI